jgi:hypothetical protein
MLKVDVNKITLLMLRLEWTGVGQMQMGNDYSNQSRSLWNGVGGVTAVLQVGEKD